MYKYLTSEKKSKHIEKVDEYTPFVSIDIYKYSIIRRKVKVYKRMI